MTVPHLRLVPDLAMTLSIDDLPAEVRDAAVSHAAWYAARNAEDLRFGGPPRKPRWTKTGASLAVRRTFLALGIAAGLQRGTTDVDALRERLERERTRAAELQLVADAGVELAQAQARVTEASALLLAHPSYSRAATEAIPKQRDGVVA